MRRDAWHDAAMERSASPSLPPAGAAVLLQHAVHHPQQDKNDEHLRLLSIFHYVYAAVTGVFSLIPLVHVGMGVAMLTGAFPPAGGSGSGPPPPAFLGWFFIAIGSTIIIVGLTMAALNFFTGRMLSERQSRVFCMVIAAINCLNMPLGTALGVFTLVVLSRPEVREQFEGRG